MITQPLLSVISGYSDGTVQRWHKAFCVVGHRIHRVSFLLTLSSLTHIKAISLIWDSLTGTRPCSAFGYKDLNWYSVLAMPEPKGMNGQTEWQTRHTSQLVDGLAGQKCLEAWGTVWTWADHNVTALVVRRQEERRKEVADISPSKTGNDLCSTRSTSVQIRWQHWGDCWEAEQNAYGLFQAL